MVLYMLLASTFTMGKAVLCYVAPIFFIAVRMLVGGSLVALYQGASSCTSVLLSFRNDVFDFLKIILLHIYCAYVLEFWALQYISSAKTALFYNFSPFITALLSVIFLGEHLTNKKITGLLIGFIGLLYLVITRNEFTYSAALHISIPEIVLLVAVISSCYGWIVFKQLLDKGYAPLQINMVGMLGGGFCALVTSLLCEKQLFIPVVSDLSVCLLPYGFMNWVINFLGKDGALILLILFYMLLMIIVSNIIFYNLYGYLLKKYSATFLSFAGFTCPLFAAFFGFLYLNEPLTGHFFFSALIIFLGLLIFYQEELKVYAGKN